MALIDLKDCKCSILFLTRTESTSTTGRLGGIAGVPRRTPAIQPNLPVVDVDSVRVKNRIEHLQSFKSIKPYQRQKCSLQRQLESYLWSLPEKKTLGIASPQDVITFLIWKDKFGKTVIHSDSCTATHKGGSCSCQKSLAAGTIDSYIGKLRTIFRENGR